MTPLMIASSYGLVEVVHTMMHKGVDVDECAKVCMVLCHCHY